MKHISIYNDLKLLLTEGIQEKISTESGFDYHANKRACMTCNIFFDWLRRFDHHIALSGRRKESVPADQLCAHDNAGILPLLESVDVFYLPPSSSSKIQPIH